MNVVVETGSGSDCVANATMCTVPFTFSSDADGTLEISNLQIQTNATSYLWNTSDVSEGTQYRVRIKATDGMENSSYDQSDQDFTISHHILDVSNLTVLYSYSRERIFEFLITNNYNAPLSNISWTFNTGQSNISSQFNVTLLPNETIFNYVQYDYQVGPPPQHFNVTAAARAGKFSDSETIAIQVSA